MNKKPSISTLLHIISLAAIVCLTYAVFYQSWQLRDAERNLNKQDLFYNARTTNLYKCVQNHDFECPEWKYFDGRKFL